MKPLPQWLDTADINRVKALDEIEASPKVKWCGPRDAAALRLCAKGERLVCHAPLCKGKRVTLIDWLANDGSGHGAFQEGTIKRYHFKGFVQRHLLPILKRGDIVLWDNARIHEASHVVEQIRSRGADVKPLPRYSPEYNPIELLWSQIKHRIRKAKTNTVETLEAAIHASVERVSGQDAKNWFEHVGFRYQPI